MADVELSYKGSTIGSLSASGSMTIETAGKYCDADIDLTYTKSGGGGVVLSAMDQSVSVKNGRSGTVTVNRLMYNATTFLAVTSANISAGVTSSYSNLATDGTHIWLRFSAGTTLSYNDAQATYVRDGSYFEITIPSEYDNTIPFVIS